MKSKTGKVSKTDKVDSYLLWKVYELSLIKNNTHRYFKPLTIVDVELRPLLMKEGLLYKDLQRIRNASMIGVDIGSDVEMLEKMVEDVRKEIINKAINIIPRFMKIANSLGLDREDIGGLTGLAGLLVYNKSTSNRKSINYLGLLSAKGRDARRIKKSGHKARRYLLMLRNVILWKNSECRPPRYRDMKRVLKMVMGAMN